MEYFAGIFYNFGRSPWRRKAIESDKSATLSKETEQQIYAALLDYFLISPLIAMTTYFAGSVPIFTILCIVPNAT